VVPPMVPIYNSLNEGYGGAKLTAERRLEPDGEDFRTKSQSLGGGTFSSARRFEFRRFDRLDRPITYRVPCSGLRALPSAGFEVAIVGAPFRSAGRAIGCAVAQGATLKANRARIIAVTLPPPGLIIEAHCGRLAKNAGKKE